ncbi:MAG: hypothetical protein NVS2B7_19220 [Herpetosiphon sp.]
MASRHNPPAAPLRTEARFRSLLASTQDLVVLTNVHGQATEDAPLWRRFTGQSTAEFNGLGWLDAVHAEELEAARAYVQCSDCSDCSEREFHIRQWDGSYRAFRLRKSAVMDDEGVVDEWIVIGTDISETKRMNEALAHTTQRISAIFESITDAFIAVDREWRFSYVNRHAESLTGRARADLLGHNTWEVFPGLVGTTIETCFRQAMAMGEPKATELITSMTQHHYEVRAYPSSEGLSVYFRDITEQRQIEAARHASEQLAHQFIDSVPQIMWILDAEGRFIFFNQRWYEYTGRICDDAGNAGWMDNIHSDDLPHIKELTKGSYPEAGTLEGELRIRRTDGVYRWHLVKLARWNDHDGSPARWFGAAVDIDDRKRSDVARELMAEISRVLGLSIDYDETLSSLARLTVPGLADMCLIDLLDEQGRPRRVAAAHKNSEQPPYMSVINQNPPAQDSCSPLSIVLRSGISCLASQVDSAWIGQVAQNDDHRAAIHALGPRSVMVVALQARGRTLGLWTLTRLEGSEPYQHEDLLLAEELGRRASLAVDNARLYHQAQLAIHEREALLSVASHELKNPLTTLLGTGQLLQRRTATGKALTARDIRSIEVIIEQGMRVNRLLETLLDLSRLEGSQETIVQTRVDLQRLLGDLVDEIEPTLEKHVLVLTSSGEHPWTVAGDSDRLLQVFRNLIGNGVKYSPHGGTVMVALKASEHCIVVTVSDEGIGISSADMPRLFDRFYRASDASGFGISGLGIGLYVVREIVAMHGGTVTVDSKPGQGARFTVSLPSYAHVQERCPAES